MERILRTFDGRKIEKIFLNVEEEKKNLLMSFSSIFVKILRFFIRKKFRDEKKNFLEI